MTKIACRRWAVDLSTWTPTLSQLTQAVAAVQPEEQTRLMKFYFIEDFLSSLIGRLLMRKFVSDSTGINYHDVQFARDSRGKPYVAVKTNDSPLQLPKISFNVSHQGKFVVLAGLIPEQNDDDNTLNSTVDYGVGVDVMKIEYSSGKPLNEFFRLMHKKFSDTEWRYIDHQQKPDSDKLKAFMRHWCLKESYVKELGVGITIDLQKISFSVDSDVCLTVKQPLNTTTLRCNDIPMSNWYFEEHLLQPKYCAAIAFKNCRPAIGNFEILNVKELLVPSSKAENLDVVNYCKAVLKKPRKKV